jgi:hypothetical protein
MFDQEKEVRGESLWIGPKMMAGAVAGVLLSLGLCGAGTSLHFGNGMGVLRTVGLWLFLLSCLVLLIGMVVLVVEVVLAMVRKR